MSLQVVVSSPEHALCQVLLQRGILAGYTFYIETEGIDRAEHIFATELKSFPTAIQPISKAPKHCIHVMINETEEHLLPQYQDAFGIKVTTWQAEREQTAFFRIHDMLPSPSGSNIMQQFANWQAAIREGTEPQFRTQLRYWCSVQDVASALVRILPFLKSVFQSCYDISGRRGWSDEETWGEYSALSLRSNAAKSGQFTIQDLQIPSSPALREVPLSSASDQSRPNISLLHELLETHTGDGWHPTVSLRQMLMQVLAAQG